MCLDGLIMYCVLMYGLFSDVIFFDVILNVYNVNCGFIICCVILVF